MAEKTFKSYVIPGKAMDFEMHKVILMSSIPEDQLLDDLRGRLCGQVTIPPLRDRWQDIPFMLRVSIEKAVAKAQGPKNLQATSLDAMSRWPAPLRLRAASSDEGTGCRSAQLPRARTF